MREEPYEGDKDERVDANMEIALERAFTSLTPEQDNHANRTFIAEKLVQAVRDGISGLVELSEVAKSAAGLLQTKPDGIKDE